MDQAFAIVVPIFTLIGVGYLAGRGNWIGESASQGLSNFTFNLAIPALLFRTMATAALPQTETYRIWAAFFGAALFVWLVSSLVSTSILRRRPSDAPSIAMSSSFGNVVMLGVPLSMALFGEAAAAPGAVIVSLHSPILWLAGSIHLALVDRRNEAERGGLIAELVRELACNPIILAVVAGVLWRLTGLTIEPALDDAIALLGQAAIPCALVALGLSLTGFQIKGQVGTLTLILFLKLAAMPIFASILAFKIFGLPPIEAGVVTIFAAMPTGANAYLFAARQGRAMNSASGAVALGTALAVLTSATSVYLLSGG
ncbi:MAG: AEC family transporter [Hyphomicrobiaceae bacterium]